MSEQNKSRKYEPIPSKHPAERLDVYTKPPFRIHELDNVYTKPPFCTHVVYRVAAAHRRSGDARRPRGRTPQKDGSSMEVKPGYKQTEVGVIPEEWEVCNLKDVSLKITDGDHVTPKREINGYYLYPPETS